MENFDAEQSYTHSYSNRSRVKSPRQSRSYSPPPYPSTQDIPDDYAAQSESHGDAIGESNSRTASSFDRNERDPRDHRKLRRAWIAMLSAREINIRPLSILSLYLSTCFDKFSAFSAGKGLVVPLPGPSSATVPEQESDDDAPVSPVRSALSRNKASAEIITENASLHLLRSLATVMACRESMLPHFQQLEMQDEEDLSPISNTRTSMGHPPTNHRRKRRRRQNDREEFDTLFANYERDMLDRVGMSAHLTSTLGWKRPSPIPKPRDIQDQSDRWRDDIRMWRSHEQPGCCPADVGREHLPCSQRVDCDKGRDFVTTHRMRGST